MKLSKNHLLFKKYKLKLHLITFNNHSSILLSGKFYKPHFEIRIILEEPPIEPWGLEKGKGCDHYLQTGMHFGVGVELFYLENISPLKLSDL